MDEEKISEAIAHKIRALFAKSVENGATEAEAMAAAIKARELMDRYRLSMSDVDLKQEEVIQTLVERTNNLRVAAVDYCLTGIEKYCGIRTWYSAVLVNDKKIRRLAILGLKADVEMSVYLYKIIETAIDRETFYYQQSRDYQRLRGSRNARSDTKAATSSFQIGMASRINRRLVDMARELEPVAKTATGTALVVVKNQIVTQAFNDLGLNLKSFAGGMSAKSSNAYALGRAAGDKVNLLRPLGGNGKSARLN